MKYKRIVCQFCGKEATVPTLRKANYCDNCVKEYNKMQAKKYNEKAKEVKVLRPTTSTTRTINTEAIENLDVTDIIEVARELGAIRFRLIEMIQKAEERINAGNKSSEILVHAFEFEDLTKEEVWERYQNEKNSRNKRRQAKYEYSIIKGILDNITIKNPAKFVTLAIQGCKNTRNFDEYVKELEKDKDLFNNL